MHTTTSDQNQKLVHTNNHQIKNEQKQQLHDYSNHHYHKLHSHHHEHVQNNIVKSEPQHDYSDINSFHVGRRRKPNFTDQEVVFIIDQYDTYKQLLHSREASKSVIAQKQAIWKQITENLNQQYPQVERSVEDVRRKWKKLQSEAKREATVYSQSGQTTSANTGKQIHLYNRILQICRAPSAHYPLQQIPNTETFEQSSNPSSYNHQISPQSDTAVQQSPSSLNEQNHDENANIGGDNHYDQENSNNFGYAQPIPLLTTTTTTSTPLITTSSSLANNQGQNSTHENSNHYSHPHSYGGSVSKRTMDKRRRMINAQTNDKPAAIQTLPNVSTQPWILPTTTYLQQQTQLRFESLQKRKRTIDLTNQRLINNKERLLIERKNIDIKLQQNECEYERLNIEKRRTELALQKLQQQTTTNGNTPSHSYFPCQQTSSGSSGQQLTSDIDEDSMADDMSDLNE
ncbi:unnamed protein product [Didymodactylos carnosus]|uniref:Myb/SANT-like DNA-binding domain-containing protein n=1 Tax=Didymodactylos carnosus TaxID=1234261 RepID=A0A814KS42_9BILA|nr:unnamed protein product [Didymodactylos carnosus]CAF1054829.1 unnamed protein product [Didymodactylos carnosus]CAF3544454.1 unnamed protein product [Didymodactylos carnosus]CAF3824008.1 unnamed protein product [Didymodactylos carnosus]